MVHIPSHFSGITIKKSKPNGQSLKPQQLPNPKVTNKAPFRAVSVPVLQATQVKNKINPMSFVQTINNSQLQIKKIRPANSTAQATAMKRTANPSPKTPHRVLKTAVNINPKGVANLNQIVQTTNLLKKIYKCSNPIAQSSTSLSHLPPGITVKQVKHVNNTAVNVKRAIIKPAIVPAAKKPKPNPPSSVGEVLTVELEDDDESSTSNNSPQWYMRPDDQKLGNSMEEENNKEPATPSFIEITIEDSPIKPAPSKTTKEIEDESCINIEESPMKGPEKDPLNEEKSSGSDEDQQAHPTGPPRSKKMLHYSKQGESSNKNTSPNIIEIEIPPLEEEVAESTNTSQVAKNTVTEPDVNEIIEILESPAKKRRKQHTVKAIKDPEFAKNIEPVTESMQSATENTEFHPTYQRFIDLCFKLENSEDMKKIVEKKIKTYYLQVPKEYTESEEFLEMVSSKIMSMKAGPEKMYLYIKDIVDELNLQRKLAKAQAVEKEKEQGKL